MNGFGTIKLKKSSITNVPLQTYQQDFTFIVNGKDYKTTRLFSDLISPKICKLHIIDPTIDFFIIDTKEKGNFSYFLDLQNFSEYSIPEEEIPFILEVFNILENKHIEFKIQKDEITLDNVFNLIKKHEKYPQLYYKRLLKEIRFISSHFFEICSKRKEQLKSLSVDLLNDVLNNENLKLNDEDQLLEFINELYLDDSKFYFLYESVHFKNVSSKSIHKFIEIFDINDLTRFIWESLSNRLEDEKSNELILFNEKRYKSIENEINSKQKIFTCYNQNNDLNPGIIHYFANMDKDKINITSSSIFYDKVSPENILIYDNQEKYFCSRNEFSNWLKIDFKENLISPTDYTILSSPNNKGAAHPKNWAIQGSNDNKKWVNLNEQRNCTLINGWSISHTFHIDDPKLRQFRYLRIVTTGMNCWRDNKLMFKSIEFYGTVYKNPK
ncbi:hypothetical protein M9Y10_019828 [Tritrichomonas musculus]|uniref:F5/8 type C domain-containing protein n=1 Tax=Tritrichomonas musculus TaxID=1915356 RepID=A0ABR2HHE7_9EUKA